MTDVLMYDFPGSICCQMVRLTLAEKGVAYEKRIVDISGRREQFEPWYTALNPKAVVPTLSIDGEIVCDTKVITPRIDLSLDGPALTPADGDAADEMRRWMNDIMGLHYGVLLYSRKLDENRVSPRVAERLTELLELRESRPESAELLDARIAGNRRFQAILLDEAQVDDHIAGSRGIVERLETVLKDRPFVVGSQYTLADPFATAALARFVQHGCADWWEGGTLPGVARYYAAVQARPSWTDAGVQNR